ncbi:MAG: PIN domain-containing protein [Chloroflexota bacterium]|nr:PIN domain-containing protein [Chloroflexota bacterium]
MYVVLDSNIIISANYGNSAMMQFCLSISKVLDYSVIAPPIVIDEVVAKYRVKIESERDRISQSRRNLSTLLRSPQSLPSLSIDIDQAVNEYRQHIEKTFSLRKWPRLRYPTLSHREVVARAVNRRRPFYENGSGYRDTLIWLSIIQWMPAVDDQVILITSDKAFGEKDGTLHADLASDLGEIDRSEEDVVLLKSLPAFVKKYVRHRLKRVFVENSSQALGQLGIDIRSSIEAKVFEDYSGVEIHPELLNLPSEFETLYLDSIPQVSAVDVLDVREVSHAHYLLQCHADADCAFDVFVHKSDAYTLSELAIYDPDWNDHYVLGHTECQLRFILQLEVAFDNSGAGRHRVEVLSIEAVRLESSSNGH